MGFVATRHGVGRLSLEILARRIIFQGSFFFLEFGYSELYSTVTGSFHCPPRLLYYHKKVLEPAELCKL